MMIFSVLLLISLLAGNSCLPTRPEHEPMNRLQDTEFCQKTKPSINETGDCLAFRETTHRNTSYHYIICHSTQTPLTEKDLLTSLELYASKKCGLPLKLYIPDLKFYPSHRTFQSVAPFLNTLTIKSWNPLPIMADMNVMPDSQTTDYHLDESPFEDMKNLKVLDISFDGGAKFTRLSGRFFDGLNSLEALHIENLPPGASIAPGIFHKSVPHETLKCFGLLTSTIPCSCDADDSGHWLHQWLHNHKHTWTAEGKKKISYTDQITSDGSFFLCEVKVTCALTLSEHGVRPKHHQKNVVKKEIPFHHFNWESRCHPTTMTTPLVKTTVTSTTTEGPCQRRSRRSGTSLADRDNDAPCQSGGLEDKMANDEPYVQASRQVSFGSRIRQTGWLLVSTILLAVCWSLG